MIEEIKNQITNVQKFGLKRLDFMRNKKKNIDIGHKK